MLNELPNRRDITLWVQKDSVMRHRLHGIARVFLDKGFPRERMFFGDSGLSDLHRTNFCLVSSFCLVSELLRVKNVWPLWIVMSLVLWRLLWWLLLSNNDRGYAFH
ncbi:uncharacterized protein LOC113565798 [Drosophila persimilis]|uniref:uncharacterized protein LOC113565798 n=1 Tax=Drosophila persimilis TaxID=7234 RepID=UPI000F087698|nr:uncharacterized protein LOC113565798 [Drosophila persimilis]